MLHLRQGEPVSQYMEGDRLRPLPCTLRLDSFSVQCYPGTSAPQDYVSLITLHPSEGQMRVSMNRIGHLQGCPGKPPPEWRRLRPQPQAPGPGRA